jgi:GNAT superfamily N-acetyltransferase
MELEQPNPEDILDEEIRARYVDSSRGGYTQHYLVNEDDHEVGFLSLDLLPVDQEFVIYEIFVPRRLRRKGLGNRILKRAEEMARRKGYEWSLVIPKTMDEEFSQDKLEAWYQGNGYEVWEGHAFGGIRKRLPD